MNKLDIVIVDCQTNGSAAASSQMIELGWLPCTAATQQLEISSALVSLRPDQKVPGRILTMTGITAEELAAAKTEEKVLGRFIAELPEQPVLLAHYARFEKGFLEPFLEGNPPFLCTYEIARRLFPDLPSRSIRAVSGYLGHHIDETKRSAHHIEATFFIWKKLADELTARGISTIEELLTFLSAPAPKATKKRYALASDIRLKLPDQPGVYKMLGHDGRVLYVGKATSLRSRVNSYFRGQKTKGSRLNELVSQIASVDYQITTCPMEAALVESDAIKDLNPPYNRAQKAGNRAIGFSGPDLRPFAATDAKDAGSERLFGPFSSLRHLEHLHELKRAIDALPAGDTEVAHLEELGAEAEVIRAGLALFRLDYAEIRGDEIDWRRTLCKSWTESIHRARERRRLALEAEGEDDTEEEEIELPEEEFVWQPEDIARYVASSFAGCARSIHRARWLNNLSDCELRWSGKDTHDSRSMRVAGGKYYFSSSEAPEATAASGIKVHDLATYDRMQVFMTELRRLLREGHEVEVRLGSGRSLSADQIKEYIFPGDFLPDAEATR